MENKKIMSQKKNMLRRNLKKYIPVPNMYPGIKDVVKEIPGTLRGMAKNLGKAVDPAGLVSKGITGVKNFAVNQGKILSDKLQQEADHNKARDEQMIKDNFGTMEKYKSLQELD